MNIGTKQVIRNSTASEHLGKIFEQGEFVSEATIRKFRIVQNEGCRKVARNIDYYNLNAIILVGYRENSVCATQLRQWQGISLE